MGALAAVLLPLIPGLIRGAEAIFSRKPKSGLDKRDSVVGALGQVVAGIIQAKVPLPDGTTVTAPVDLETLRGLVEGVFQSMKASGGVAGPLEASYYLVKAVSITPLT